MNKNTIDLSGKNVLITGGAAGIGAAITQTFAACGANVFINYHTNEAAAKTLAQSLENDHGIKAAIFKADVSNEEEVNAMFRNMDETLGTIDFLVNNAGCESVGTAITLDLAEWDKIFNVNLRGAFMCAQQAGQRMSKQRRGVIINISSMHDKVPRKGLIHYCSAKAALNMMTRCLALELAGYNIRAIAVSPGAIETSMNREEIEKFGREKFNNWIPLGTIGDVADVAWTCAFLCSDMAKYITATEIYIDGGYKENTIPYDPRSKH